MGSPRVIADAPGAAVIGGGFIGPVHVEALRRIGVEVVGMLGSSPDRANDVAGRLGIGRVYCDLDELLSDERVGVVHIASPNAYHFEQARRVLESGRHVICEKPLATSREETAALWALAKSRPGQAAAVNYNIRYYPLCHEIRDRIRGGAIGNLIHVNGSYVQDWLLHREDYNWRVEPDGRTNLRAVADIGTHWMDLAQFVTGMPIVTVFADLWRIHGVRYKPLGVSDTFRAASPAEGHSASQLVRVETEDYAAVLFQFPSGTRGSFHVSQVTAGRKNRLTIEVAGTKGALSWDSEAPNQLWIGSRGVNQLLERDPALLSPAASAISHYPGGHAEGFPDTFKQLFLDVYGWIVEGSKAGRKPTFPTFVDGDWEAGLCEAIACSAVDGRWVSMAEEFLYSPIRRFHGEIGNRGYPRLLASPGSPSDASVARSVSEASESVKDEG
jgi:predicted dehydrogenase